MARPLAEILNGGPLEPQEVIRVRDTLVFEEALISPKIVKFLCLLVLAASIAT